MFSLGNPLRSRWISQFVPMAAVAVAAFLIIRSLAGSDSITSLSARVDPDHGERLTANIAFFEERVTETRDSLSYNRLTGLYLQRVRETGDTSDIKRAELSATKSLEVAPGEYSGLINMGLLRIAQHDFRAAQNVAQEAVALIPTRPDAYAILGDAEMALGNYAAASEHYGFFLEKAPGFSAFSRQAALAELRGNLPLAEQFWKAAIDADRADVPENSAWARVQLGTFYFTTGRLKESKAEFERALEVYPGYAAAVAGKARVAAARGDDDEAIELYRLATATVPQPDYVAALGDALQRAGKSAEVERQFALMGAIKTLFKANGVRSDLTLILFELDHGRDAAALAAEARLAYEERPSVAGADLYAWALYRAGRLDEARRLSDEALAQGTQDPMLLFHAGTIAFAQGDLEAARGRLEAVKKLNPEFSVLHAAEAADLLRRAGGSK